MDTAHAVLHLLQSLTIGIVIGWVWFIHRRQRETESVLVIGGQAVEAFVKLAKKSFADKPDETVQ